MDCISTFHISLAQALSHPGTPYSGPLIIHPTVLSISICVYYNNKSVFSYLLVPQKGKSTSIHHHY